MIMELIVPQLFGCDYAVFLSRAVVLPLAIRPLQPQDGWRGWTGTLRELCPIGDNPR